MDRDQIQSVVAPGGPMQTPLKLAQRPEPTPAAAALHLGPTAAYDLAWTVDGRLWGAFQDGAVRAWSADGEATGPLQLGASPLLCIDALPSGGVVVGGSDGAVHVIEAGVPRLIRRVAGAVAQVKAHPERRSVAVACMDGFVRVLSLDSGGVELIARAGGAVTSVCWFAGGAALAATAFAHQTLFWSWPTGVSLGRCAAGLFSGGAVALQHLCPAGRALAVYGVGLDGRAYCHRLDAGRAEVIDDLHEPSALIGSGPTAPLAALVGGAVWMRDHETGWRCVREAPRSPALWPLRVAPSPCGDALAVSLPSGRVERWSLVGEAREARPEAAA